MAPAPSPPQQRFRHGPRSDPSPCQPRNEKEEQSHRIRAASGSAFVAWKELRIGTLSVSHRRLADCSPASFRTARTTFECSKLRRVRAPPLAGRAFLGSRALECQNLCRDARLHLCPLDSYQRDSGFADDFVRIVGLNAECRAPVPQPFKPSAQSQGGPGWDWPSMVDTDRTADHHFGDGIDVLLHLTNANGFDHCHKVPGGKTFDQSLGILASVRKPREKRLCRLVGRHGVGLFKEYLADALVVHGVSGWGCRRLDQRAGLRAIGAVRCSRDPQASPTHRSECWRRAARRARWACAFRKSKRARQTCRARCADFSIPGLAGRGVMRITPLRARPRGFRHRPAPQQSVQRLQRQPALPPGRGTSQAANPCPPQAARLRWRSAPS